MTLSISDIDPVIGMKAMSRQPRKTAIVYLFLSLAAIVVANIYALFGHGVRSQVMTWMFLYPMLGGALLFFLMYLLVPWISSTAYYRVSCNLYNSGIAVLTTAGLLKGILEIAGTSSPYTIVFTAAGWVLAAAGLISFIFSLVKRK